MVRNEAAFKPVLLVVRDALPVELLVIFSAAMELVTMALGESSRVHALLVVVTPIMVGGMISFIVFTPRLSKWLGTSLVVSVTPVSDRLPLHTIANLAGLSSGEHVVSES